MIISDNPPPLTDQYWQITDNISRGGAAAAEEVRPPGWAPLATGHLSPLAAITQINKLSESHINLTTSEAIEAIEAMCHLRVLHTHWPRHHPRHSFSR